MLSLFPAASTEGYTVFLCIIRLTKWNAQMHGYGYLSLHVAVKGVSVQRCFRL